MNRKELAALVSTVVDGLQELNGKSGAIPSLEESYIIELNTYLQYEAESLGLTYEFHPPDDNFDTNFIFSNGEIEICFGLEQGSRRFFMAIRPGLENYTDPDGYSAVYLRLIEAFGSDDKTNNNDKWFYIHYFEPVVEVPQIGKIMIPELWMAMKNETYPKIILYVQIVVKEFNRNYELQSQKLNQIKTMPEQQKMNEINSLLKEVSSISKKYDKIAEITGERFNLFKILGLQYNEVRTHSAFIGELLNPKGSHGQGDLFLKLFLSFLKDKKIIDALFEMESCCVEVEKYIGTVNKDYPYGGRIDIIISNATHAIIIENKIYAGDQPKQLIRYSNYAKKYYSEESQKNYRIFYLTREGEPCKDWDDNNNGKYYPLSYKDDILLWLKECLKEAATLPHIRESLSQYIHLIEYLTNQSTNDNMTTEIAAYILRNSEMIESAYEVSKSIPNMEAILLEKLAEQLKRELKNINSDYDFNLNKNDSKYTYFDLEKDEYRLSLGYTHNHSDLERRFFIGLRPAANKELNSRMQLKVANYKISNPQHILLNSDRWYYYENVSNKDSFKIPTAFKLIYEDQLAKEIIELLKPHFAILASLY